MARTIELLFDYVSPYAYLASTQLGALAARHGADVLPTPVLLGALLTAAGSRGPAEIPARREYLIHDITRLARALAVPIAPPATHPFNPLAALRITWAAPPEQRGALMSALFRGAWVEGRRVDDPAVVAAIAAEVGLDGDALGARAASAEVKERLRAATDGAIARGAFGVPTMLVDGELF